jgi:hypothetical protein
MTMDARTAEALEKSILHWQENVNAKSFDAISIGGDSCALCTMFRKPEPGQRQTREQEMCIGCPVAEWTGLDSCFGTPYESAGHEWQRLDSLDDSNADLTIFRAAAQAELDFLVSLRDPVDATQQEIAS